MNWLPLALLTALLFGLQNAFARAASKGVTDELGTIVLEATAAACVLGYALSRARPLNGDGRSIGWAVAAGVAVAAGNVAYFALLRRGAGLATMGPVVLAGATIVTAIAGVVAFGERVTALRGLGLALAASGIVLLAQK